MRDKLWTTDLPTENGFYWVKLRNHNSYCIIDVGIDGNGFPHWDMHGDSGVYDAEFGHWEEYIKCRSVEPITPPGFKRGTFMGVPFLMKMKMADTDTDTGQRGQTYN